MKMTPKPKKTKNLKPKHERDFILALAQLNSRVGELERKLKSHPPQEVEEIQDVGIFIDVTNSFIDANGRDELKVLQKHIDVCEKIARSLLPQGQPADYYLCGVEVVRYDNLFNLTESALVTSFRDCYPEDIATKMASYNHVIFICDNGGRDHLLSTSAFSKNRRKNKILIVTLPEQYRTLEP